MVALIAEESHLPEKQTKILVLLGIKMINGKNKLQAFILAIFHLYLKWHKNC